VVAGNPVYPAALLGWSGTTFPETTLREYARHYGLRRTIAMYRMLSQWMKPERKVIALPAE